MLVRFGEFAFLVFMFYVGCCFLVFVNSVGLRRFSCCMFGLCLVTCLFCSAWLLQMLCWRCCGLVVVCGLGLLAMRFDLDDSGWC